MSCPRAGWRARAAPSLRSSSKSLVTPSSARQPLKESVMDLPVQQFRTKAEQSYLDLFETAQEALPGARDPFVSDLRTTAIEAYSRIGLPHRRIEAWKYTDLRARLTGIYPLIKAAGAGARAARDAYPIQTLRSEIPNLPAYRLVVVEVDLRADLSDLGGLKAAGVEAVSLSRALEKPQSWLKEALASVNPRDDDPVLALNTALMTGGVAMRVREGVILDKPIHLIEIDGAGDPVSTFTRNVVIAEPGSAATLIESFASGRSLQRNAVTELRVCAKAAIKHVKVQRESGDAFHLSTWLVELGADARYEAFQFSTGAALARNQIYLRFAGEGVAADISGAFLLRDRQHCDTTLLVEHRVPHCMSREFFKGVLDGDARGIFQGKIVVSPGAQKTDGKQMAGALLLSETAEFDSKPELEIFADDVVCGHGSTSGQIDRSEERRVGKVWGSGWG